MTKPYYTHDCDQCKFLGCKGRIDIYLCHNESRDPECQDTTVVARYGNEGSEYASTLLPFAFHSPEDILHRSQGWHHFALQEIIKLKLLNHKVITSLLSLYKKAEAKHSVAPSEWHELNQFERMSERNK